LLPVRRGPAAAQEITEDARCTGEIVGAAVATKREDALGYELVGIGKRGGQYGRVLFEEVEDAPDDKLELAQFCDAILAQNLRLCLLALGDKVQLVPLAAVARACSASMRSC
jgi:hypothetical protein